MSTPIVGAQLFTLREFTKTAEDLARTFDKVRAIGYHTVQVSGIGPIAPETVGKLLSDSGLSCVATHVGWPRFLGELDQVIAEHRLWGCVHAAIGGLPGEYRSLDGLRRFVDELGPVAAKLAEAGMDFSYHNHNHEFIPVDGEPWLARLYETAPADVLKAELDTYWVQAGGGDPAAWIRKCAGRAPLLHLKDMTVAEGREQRFAPIGEGNMNWPAILEAAEAAGVEYLLVEQDNCYGRDPFDCLASSYAQLRAWGYR